LVAHLDSVLRDVLASAPPPSSPLAIQPHESAPQISPEAPRKTSADANPNHHLWNNHGIWFLHCTIYPTKVTKERLRCTLQTSCIVEARQRRDAQMAELAAQGLRPALK
jgi:hypothetical protein